MGSFYQYHLGIVGAFPFLNNDLTCAASVGEFISNILALDVSYQGAPLLELAYRHYSAGDAVIPSTRYLRVALRVTQAAVDMGVTLEVATQLLCRNIFDPRAEDIHKILTPLGIMGISPIGDLFGRYWRQECFRDCIKYGNRLLNTIHVKADDDYLPEWAFILCFAVVAGLHFEVFSGDLTHPMDCVQVYGISGGSTAAKVLVKYYTSFGYETGNWEERHENYKKCLGLAITNLEAAINPWSINQAIIFDELSDALYEATRGAAMIFVFRECIFKDFLKRRGEVIVEARVGASALTHHVSVVSAVAPSKALILANADNNSDASLAAGDYKFATSAGTTERSYARSIPVAVATTAASFLISGPIIAAVAGLITLRHFTPKREVEPPEITEKRNAERAELEGLGASLEYPWKILATIAQAWGLAYDARKLVRLVHRQTVGYKSVAEFVDNSCRAEWDLFIRPTKAALKCNVLSTDLEPSAVSSFLQDRVKLLQELYRTNVT